MTISNKTKRYGMRCILWVLLLGAIAYFFATCASIEPGGNCIDVPPGVEYRYDVPPYIGDAVLIHGTDDWLWIIGSGERAGQDECTAATWSLLHGDFVRWKDWDF